MSKVNLENYDCDRCKFKFKRGDLKLQKGLLVCPYCYDDISTIKHVDMKLAGSYRSDGSSYTPSTTPTIFTITAAGGITPSHSQSRGLKGYYMKIVSNGGAITVTANPQIVAGSDGDFLTLQGTSDTDSVRLSNGNGIKTVGQESFTLGENDVISFVYDDNEKKWVETSRAENGGF